MFYKYFRPVILDLEISFLRILSALVIRNKLKLSVRTTNRISRKAKTSMWSAQGRPHSESRICDSYAPTISRKKKLSAIRDFVSRENWLWSFTACLSETLSAESGLIDNCKTEAAYSVVHVYRCTVARGDLMVEKKNALQYNKIVIDIRVDVG